MTNRSPANLPAKSGTIDTIFMPDAGDAAPFLSQVLSAAGVRAPQVLQRSVGGPVVHDRHRGIRIIKLGERRQTAFEMPAAVVIQNEDRRGGSERHSRDRESPIVARGFSATE